MWSQKTKEVVSCTANTWYVWCELDNLVLEYFQNVPTYSRKQWVIWIDQSLGPWGPGSLEETQIQYDEARGREIETTETKT